MSKGKLSFNQSEIEYYTPKMKEKVETTIVKCERCGKLIQPNAMGVPVDYVWRDGRSLCHECNKKEAKGE